MRLWYTTSVGRAERPPATSRGHEPWAVMTCRPCLCGGGRAVHPLDKHNDGKGAEAMNKLGFYELEQKVIGLGK